MNEMVAFDEQLLQRLPLPLAQLCRRSLNAQTAQERHNAAFYVWEAALKLFGSVAVVAYANLTEHDPALVELLKSLARPSLGHWWGFARSLAPVLAGRDDPGFTAASQLVFGQRDDLPRAAGLYAALIDASEGRGSPHSTVRLAELFDRLVEYRNREIGHGAAGLREAEFYARMWRVLLAGAGEVLGRLDVLAGRRLLAMGEVRREPGGGWLVDRYILIGESPKRLEPLEIPEGETSRLPRPELVYLEITAEASSPASKPGLSPLHPLVLFEGLSDFFFLNARRGERGLEYLCYPTGESIRRAKLPPDHRELLARVLGQSVDEQAAEAWANLQMAQEPRAPAAPVEPTDARSIGGFTLLGRLGKGGMGVVYRAWQPSLGREVALKCMLGVGNSQADQRFLREIRALGRVDHPNVVKVFSSGTDKDQLFYAMELIEGAELSRVWDQLRGGSTAEVDESHWRKALSTACDQFRAEETRLSDTEIKPRRPSAAPRAATAGDEGPLGARAHVTLVVELVRQVAEATHLLHEAGVIHRDIKPGNIMLNLDLKHPVLMDLGLAQLADETEGRLTRTKQFVGTLRYASPEQILNVAKVDRRTDIYSLGATLWELLTLRSIFDVGDDTTTPDLVLKIQTNDPETPRKHNKYVPKDLEAIVMKCLEKDRTRRYPTANELANDLGRFLAGEPVLAQPPSLTYLTGKFVRRHRAPLGAAAFMVLILVCGVVAAFVGIDQQRRVALRERRAVLQANEKLQEQLYDSKITVAERELTQNQDVGLAGKLLNECPAPLRGWEWDYLMRLRDGPRPPLGDSERGHKSGLWMADFSPDGRRIASVSIDGTLKVWDAASGRLEYSVDADAEAIPLGLGRFLSGLGIARIPIMCVQYSPDGRFLATGSVAPSPSLNLQNAMKNAAGVVTIWDAATGRKVSRFDKQLGVVLSVAYSPDGRRIASSSMNPANSFVVWDAETREVIKVMEGHKSQVHRLRFSPDGRLLVSADANGKVSIWDAATLVEVRSKAAHPAPVVDVAFTPDGLRFATAGQDGLVRVWKTANFEKVFDLTGHTNATLGVAFSPDGRRIASAGFDKTVRVWDAKTGKEKLTLRGHTDTVWSVGFSQDGRRLVSASFDKTARVWDATPREERKGPGEFTIAGPGDHRVNRVTFSSDGRYLASSSWDKEVHLMDGATGKAITDFKGHTLAAFCVAFSPDGKRLASASWDHTVKVWDRERGQELLTFSEHTGPAHSVAFSPDGLRLVSGGFDGQVKVWDASTGKVIAHCDGFVFPVLAVAFSPDGKHVASAGTDRAVKIWDADRGKSLLTLKGHEGTVHGLSFSPDGKRLASASWDHTLRIWNADSEERVATSARELLILKGHEDRVNGVAFSPDGQRIASASEDKTVRVWDANTGKEVMPPRLHRGVLYSVAFSPDGKRLAVGCWADSSWVKTWNVE